LWFGLLEEMIYWVSFTVAAGCLAGSLAAALAQRHLANRRLHSPEVQEK
jgi:hypothetical protein